MAEPILSAVMFTLTGAGALYYYLRYRNYEAKKGKKTFQIPSSPFRQEPQYLLSLRTIIAHESGHAITAWYSSHVISVDEISIQLTRGWVKEMRPVRECTDMLYDSIITGLAGMAAEVIVLGKIGSSFESRGDLRRTIAFARKLLMDSHRPAVQKLLKKYSEEDFKLDIAKMFSANVTSDIRIILNSGYIDAKKRILAHESGFNRLQKKLLEQRTLNADDIAKLFGPRIWGPK